MNDQIIYQKLDAFTLDPKNPRLGRNIAKDGLPDPNNVLKTMLDWSLEELATSFLESGFWPHEAVLCVEERPYGEPTLVVVEGNRRIAALQCLHLASQENPLSPKWASMIAEMPPRENLFSNIPYILLDSREEVDAFLGFRHVTGIKEWDPTEKAQFISYLINERDMSYRDVMRKIGSKTNAVRQNYIAYSLLLQLDDMEGISIREIEKRFSVLYLSLRTAGVQNFLGINIQAEPEEAKNPVPADSENNLRDYVKWLFGDGTTAPFVKDSRQVDKFGLILNNSNAVLYLKDSKRPSFDKAYAIAGGDLLDVRDLLQVASSNLSDALSLVHRHVGDVDVREVSKRIIQDAQQLSRVIGQD